MMARTEKEERPTALAGHYRAILLSSLGGALEFYDFIIFGVFAAYLSRAFFPTQDSTMSLLFTFAVFGAGYLARPIGGLLFGARGDARGRRDSFVLSLVVMSGATLAIAFLPAYETSGLPATIAFVVLRLVQGFSLGGELPGAITYVVEVAPKNRRTFACGIVFACVTSGVLIATAISALLHATLQAQDMQAYGWRIAFLFGGALGVIGWWLRRALHESPEFLRIKALGISAGQVGNPLGELFKDYGWSLVAAICSTGVVATFNGLLFAHMPAYLGRTLGYAGSDIAAALNVASAITAVSLVIACWFADYIPRIHVFRFGCLVIAVGAIPAYRALVDHSLPLTMAFALIGLSAAFTHGTFAAILADLFPTKVRFSGVALSLNLGSVLFSGPIPFVASSLIELMGRQDSPAYVLVGSALLALVTSVLVNGRLADNPETSTGPAAVAQELP